MTLEQMASVHMLSPPANSVPNIDYLSVPLFANL